MGARRDARRRWEGGREGREGGKERGEYVRVGVVRHGVSPHDVPEDAVENHGRHARGEDLLMGRRKGGGEGWRDGGREGGREGERVRE